MIPCQFFISLFHELFVHFDLGLCLHPSGDYPQCLLLYEIIVLDLFNENNYPFKDFDLGNIFIT